MSTFTSNVELRNNVRLLLNVELRNYVISRQIVERRVTSECYLNIVVSQGSPLTLKDGSPPGSQHKICRSPA